MNDAMSLLDGEVPYGTVTENHDYGVLWDRSSSIENSSSTSGAITSQTGTGTAVPDPRTATS